MILEPPPEPFIGRLSGLLLAFTVIAGFVLITHQFWAAAHGGGDQNAYLVAGRLIAQRGDIGFEPADPSAFIGRMWVKGADGRYFPKYPAGMPLIVAGVMRAAELTGHGDDAVRWAYRISPAATAAALLGAFFLARALAGSFAGVLAVLMLASSPLTLGLANNPNSHALALGFATWGICLLVRWWQRGSLWRAMLAGLLLGSAATIRYSEALLALPAILVILFNLRRRTWLQVATLLLAWAIPVAAMLISNRILIGAWTGYGLTGESTPGEAFTGANLQKNWQPMLSQLNSFALFAILPIGMLGLLMLLAHHWRAGLILWAWLVPGMILYSSYYWAPLAEAGSIHYLRFFLTLLVPVVIAAAWLLVRLTRPDPAARPRAGAIAAVCLFMLAAAAHNLWRALPTLESQYRAAQAIEQGASIITRHAPAGSAIFAPEEFLNHLQFTADYQLHSLDPIPGAQPPPMPTAPRTFLILRAAQPPPPNLKTRKIDQWIESPDTPASPWWRPSGRHATNAAWQLVEILP